MKGNHKSHQTNTCHSGTIGSLICITYNHTAAEDADNEEEVIGEQIDATKIL